MALAAGAAIGQAPAQSHAQPSLPPNELGRVMVLEYHKIDHPEARWTRTPDNFRRDLQRLWDKGYRTLALGDYLAGKVALPAGTTPVVLTFDDSSPGQFRMVERGGQWVIAPECGVGILEAFARDHPGFGRAATFYVLPGADPPNRLFNQADHATKKLQHLAQNGYEIGNHTLWHANLAKYGEPEVRRQIIQAQEWVQRHVPGYVLRTLALPHGAYPKQLEWAISGSVDGKSYRNDAIMMVAGGAAPSPFARALDPYRLPRIQAVDADFGYWIQHFDQRPEQRFVSDGDPAVITVPRGRAGEVRPGLGQKVVER